MRKMRNIRGGDEEQLEEDEDVFEEDEDVFEEDEEQYEEDEEHTLPLYPVEPSTVDHGNISRLCEIYVENFNPFPVIYGFIP